jgi:GTP-binding protein
MHYRRAHPAARDRWGAVEERGLTLVSFVGSFPAGDFVIDPPLPEVALVGRSNVGKSSLINVLLGRRAIAHTSKTPGKTRHCNVYDIDHLFYVVDLPGYGYAQASKTMRRGFSKLLREYLSSDRPLVGIVWLLDVRRDPSPQDLEMADLLAARGIPVLVAVTKADKVSRGRRGDRVRLIRGAVGSQEDQCLVTSAKTGEGVAALRESVQALVDGAQPPRSWR